MNNLATLKFKIKHTERYYGDTHEVWKIIELLVEELSKLKILLNHKKRK